jgi:hypothetical protein
LLILYRWTEKERELDYFIEKTKVDELMVATAIYQHEAGFIPTILGQLKI